MIHLHLTPAQRDEFASDLGTVTQAAILQVIVDEFPAAADAFRRLAGWAYALRGLPILPDNPPPRERQPGAGYTRRDEHGNAVGIPDPNDDIHQQLETDPNRPQVPLHMPKDTQTSEAGMSVDMTPPRVPGG